MTSSQRLASNSGVNGPRRLAATASRVSSATRSALRWAAAVAPAAAAVPTCAARSATLPATHTPGDFGAAGGVRGDLLAGAHRMRYRPQAERGQEAGARHHSRRDRQHVAANDHAVAQPHPDEAIVDDPQRRHLARNYPDPAGGQLPGVVAG